MRKLGFLAFALALAPALAACGDDGDDTQVEIDPSLSGVFPTNGLVGRTVRVQISGDASAFSAPTVSFGDGVTVENVSVASPTAIYADVTIASTAGEGLRTVTVSEGGATLELKDAFDVRLPLEVSVQGTLAQGSVVVLRIENRDFESPFDTTSDGQNFVGVQLESGAGVNWLIEDVTPYTIDALALVDIDATGGPLQITSGISADEQVTSEGGDFTIAARTPTPLTAGTPVTGTLTGAYATEVYELTPGAGAQLVSADLTTNSQTANPFMLVVDSSGSLFLDDLIDVTANFSEEQATGEKRYLVVWDNTGTESVPFELLANVTPYTPFTEGAANNDTGVTAQSLTLAAVGTGAFSAGDDVDYYKFTATAADVGKRFCATTAPGESQTDTVLQFFQGATGSTEFGTRSSDADFHENHASPAIPAAGTYYLRVSYSPDTTFAASRDAYKLTVLVE